MSKQRTLTTQEDFQQMMIFTRPISIYQQGELIDSGIIVKSHDNEVVVGTNGDYYVKENCKFYYVSEN